MCSMVVYFIVIHSVTAAITDSHRPVSGAVKLPPHPSPFLSKRDSMTIPFWYFRYPFVFLREEETSFSLGLLVWFIQTTMADHFPTYPVVFLANGASPFVLK